eukprot:NODE_75_length_23955_cov_0.435069.p22 type:complete len:120 gc:universal NODE_75_length_23955_cov_0.435069:9447-9088(-)
MGGSKSVFKSSICSSTAAMTTCFPFLSILSNSSICWSFVENETFFSFLLGDFSYFSGLSVLDCRNNLNSELLKSLPTPSLSISTSLDSLLNNFNSAGLKSYPVLLFFSGDLFLNNFNSF